MIQHGEQLGAKLSWNILAFSRRIAGSSQIKAICICGDLAPDLPDPKAILEVLLVIRGFQPRLLNYVKVFDERSSMFYVVDEWVFERDVAVGFLGEALAGKLIFPYLPLINGTYLSSQQVKLKKRLILELLENLVLSFPELSYELRIRPEYFLYETLLSRARLFPLTVYRLTDFTGERKEQNVKNSISGYSDALKELEQEGMIYVSGSYVRIAEKFVDNFKRRRVQFINIVKTAQRAQRSLFLSSLGVFPEILAALSKNREMLFRLRPSEPDLRALRQIEDPQNYLCVPTAHGVVPLANKADIAAIARRVLSASKDAVVAVERIGGVLNDVYVTSVSAINGQEKKVVVKKYRDWSNFKWFPLSLWTVGTRTFAVLGSSRLEREIAINQLLDSKGFDVPRILHVSSSQRLVLMEYVEGENVSNIIRRIAGLKSSSPHKKDLRTISRVGKKLAKVHAFNIALGDTKPENFVIGTHGEIFLMDFEQAARNGDKVWDVAEFLYYAGHYVPPLGDVHKAELIAEAFISGYVEAGGNPETVKKAASPKYTKVFSVFTLPNVMLALSNICRKSGVLKA